MHPPSNPTARMADRVYPASRPAASSLPPQSNSNPPNKTQFLRPTPPPYRSAQKTPARRRSRCCSCCLWLTFIIITLIVLVAIAAAIIYVLYRPQRPAFAVSAVRFSSFTLTSDRLNSNLNLTVTARNPNKKLVFYYDPISISALSNGVQIGDGSFASFIHPAKNTTLLKAAVSRVAGTVDSASAVSLSAGLKKSEGLPLQIKLETKVKVKMGAFKTGRVRIAVNCDGINAAVPKRNSKAAAASTPDASCKVKLRIKIWKWQL